MKARILQHVPFEGPGNISAWLAEQGAEVDTVRLYQGAQLGANVGYDLVVVMGGPMSVNDHHEYPWLQEEKRYLRDVMQAGQPLLGICLGAQMICSALGASVYRSPEREIGWFPIEGLNATGAFQFPSALPVFHWHGETFDLPAGAVHLARSPGCSHQAFQLGRRTIGLQFHLEVTPGGVETMLDACSNELKQPGTYVQSRMEIERAEASLYAQADRTLRQLLDYLAR